MVAPEPLGKRVTPMTLLVVTVPEHELCEDARGRCFARYRVSCSEDGETWEVWRRWTELRSE